MPTYPANIDLSTLDGTNGFRVPGLDHFDHLGWSVAAAGDVNGDGFGDFVIGAYMAGVTGEGASYVVFGQAGGFAADFDVSTLDGTNGFKLSGGTSPEWSGFSVASAGDVNGDGFADLVIGVPRGDPSGGNVRDDKGAAYIVFGKASGFAANEPLSALGTDGMRIGGVAKDDMAGLAVASAGDVNGDGYDDIIVGSARTDLRADTSGASYVVFGGPSSPGTNIELSSLNGSNGFKISGTGARWDFSGKTVASAGDINGDGFADILVGVPYADSNVRDSGASYVIYGKATGFSSNIDPTALDGSNGFRISGETRRNLTGWSVASAGDVNGDGYADMIISARGAASSYVVFGDASGFAADIKLSSFDGTNGFQIVGQIPGRVGLEFGWSVASAGDVNGDGYDDVIIGAIRGNPEIGSSNSGAAYVLFGKASGFAATFDILTVDGSNGFSLSGKLADGFDENSLGYSVSAGDLNDDGFSDLIIGAPRDEPPGEIYNADWGATYVVYGKAPDTAVTLDGTQASQTLAGGDFNDTLSGRAGNDTLHGNGGTDSLYGGLGNDTLLGGSGDDTLHGGAGNDTLVGGAGRDRLLGGDGQDTFVFKAVTDSGIGGPARDAIADFQQGQDHIDLSAIDAGSASGAFTFVGTASFSHHAGELRQFDAVGGNTIIAGDVNGDGVADFQIALNGSVTLSAGDFLL